MKEHSEELKDKLKRFVRKYGNYKPYKCGYGIVKKVFNRGMGALDFYRVYEDKRIIAVNRLLWNRTDERKLDDLKAMLGGEWRIVWCEFGYPLWYNNWLDLRFAIDEKERDL